MSKQYAERDIMEQGAYYSRHVSAMTGEKLHSKSDIAAELAHRDIKIDLLETALLDVIKAMQIIAGPVMDAYAGSTRESQFKAAIEAAIEAAKR